MSKSKIARCVLVAGLTFRLCDAALAQTTRIGPEIESRSSEAEAADEAPWSVSADRKDKKLLLVPVPIVDPTIGTGLALAGLYTFAPEGTADAPTKRRSTLAVGAAYTDTDSWMVGGGLKLHLDEDRYRTKLTGGYGNLNLKWYGTSSDSPFFDNPVSFRTRGVIVDGNVERRLTDHFYLGISGRYLAPTASAKIPIDVLPELKLDFDLTAVGVIGEYDSRDNTWYPESGSLATINLLSYLEALGSDREFGTADAAFAHYWKLSGSLVLAGQARVATVGDNTPFFMLSTVNLRGFPLGQYMSRSAGQVQAELRWRGTGRIGAVVFAGSGVTTDSSSRWGPSEKAYGYGAGLRYLVSEVDRMNVGLDVASGSSNDFTVYFRIGEAF